MLPLAPVVGLLVVRRIELLRAGSWLPGLRELALPAACALALCLLVAWGDYRLAATAREAAAQLMTCNGKDRPRWFQGHWGFQYYLQEAGAAPFDRKSSSLDTGDLMAIAENNTNIFQDIYDQGTPLKVLELAPSRLVSTMNYAAGAGYYSSGFGPLPYRFGGDFGERYHLITFRQPVRPR